MRDSTELLKAEIDRLAQDGIHIIENEVSQSKDTDGKHEMLAPRKASDDVLIRYNAWYSEALPLIRAVLPERYDEFASYYQPSKTRKLINYQTYRIADYLTKVEESYTGFDFNTAVLNKKDSFVNLFKVQIGIVKSCKNRIESKLDNIKAMLQAELFDNELDSAKHLHQNKFYRAGGMLAGVVLENHLKNVCMFRGITLPKNPTISNYNELLKSNDVIGVAEWRHLSLLGDLRNLCSHGKERDPTKEETGDLIDGVAKVIRRVY